MLLLLVIFCWSQMGVRDDRASLRFLSSRDHRERNVRVDQFILFFPLFSVVLVAFAFPLQSLLITGMLEV